MNHRLTQANHHIDELTALNAKKKQMHFEMEQSYHRDLDTLHERGTLLNNAARKMFFYSDMTSNEVATWLADMPLTALVQLRDIVPADRRHMVDYAIAAHKAVPASGISEEFFDSINEMLNGMPAPVGEVLPDNVVPIKDTTNTKQPSTSSRCHLCGLTFSEHLDNAAHSFEPEQPQPAIEL
jgi:hypothetical protein